MSRNVNKRMFFLFLKRLSKVPRAKTLLESIPRSKCNDLSVPFEDDKHNTKSTPAPSDEEEDWFKQEKEESQEGKSDEEESQNDSRRSRKDSNDPTEEIVLFTRKKSIENIHPQKKDKTFKQKRELKGKTRTNRGERQDRK